MDAPLGEATMGEAPPADPTAAIAVRTNFDSLALWRADLKADASGHVEEVVTLPDSLTKYRIFAYAHCAGSHAFGKGESKIQVTQPMSLRLSLPRFLNFGDVCSMTAVVQNLTGTDAVVHVGCRMQNLQHRGSKGFRVELKPGQRKELRFPVASMEVGTARFQVGGSIVKGGGRSLGFGDAEERQLPVWTPATSEAFATYGEIDKDGGVVVQGLKPPADVWPQFGGLEVSTSSTILQALTDAVIYLHTYPYECTEQTASKLIALLAIRDVLDAFQAPGLPEAAALQRCVTEGLRKLTGAQRRDGSYGWWRADSPPSPFLTLHVALAFGLAKQKEPTLVEAATEAAIAKLVPLLGRIETLCGNYDEGTIRELRAYACYVLAKLGHGGAVARVATDLWKEKDQLSWEAMAWLAFGLRKVGSHEEIVKEVVSTLKSRVTETADAANFVTAFRDNGEDQLVLLKSERRTDGVVLEFLLAADPNDPLAVKMVKGLLKHKKKGRWQNTQENCFILIALDAYFRAQEGAVPDFVARAWVDSVCVLQDTFKGREAKTQITSVPMAAVCSAAAEGFEVPGGEADRAIVLQKQGAGRLYYRIGLTYAPRDLKLAPSDQGFAVAREYTAVGDPAQVAELAPGEGPGYRIKLGATVKVTVTVALRSRRYHVALVDKLPAGLEAVNPALQGGAGMEKEAAAALKKQQTETRGGRGCCWFWNPRWYEHDNLRDERVEAFGSLVWEGVHTYAYIARATTCGTFVTPPATAEEMYSPEVFGRTGTMTVIVA